MMVAARAFGAGRAAELGAEDDERVVQQAALLQVLEQAGDGLIDLRGELRVVGLDLRVRIPLAAAAAAVEELHEAHAALDEPARDEALLAERLCVSAWSMP